jgi:hypothetical protein
MTVSRENKWAVLGAVHLDLTCSLPAEFVASESDTQTWVDWNITSGGVAANIVEHLSEADLGSIFFALPGEGLLGDYALDLASKDIVNCDLVRLESSATDAGIVCLLYVDGDHSRRLVVGPNRAQVDVVRYGDIRRIMLEHIDEASGLFVDGYLLRCQAKDWVADLEWMAADGWRLHLELVPHDIWKTLTLSDLRRIGGACTSISSSILTIERLLDLPLDPLLTVGGRSMRVAQALADKDATKSVMHLRWGVHDASEFCLILQPSRHGIFWRYVHSDSKAHRSSQDRLYVRESTNTVPKNWRQEIGRFTLDER